MEEIAFDDWSERLERFSATPNSAWTPAYGFPAACQDSDEESQVFLASAVMPDGGQLLTDTSSACGGGSTFLALETILEENSDELDSSDSDSDSESDSSSQNSVVHITPDVSGGESGSESERDVAVPKKRRRRDLAAFRARLPSEDEESLSRSSSLLQFESLEQAICRGELEEESSTAAVVAAAAAAAGSGGTHGVVVFRTSASDAPFVSDAGPQSFSSFSFDSLETTVHKRNESPGKDSLDSTSESSSTNESSDDEDYFLDHHKLGSNLRQSRLRSFRSFDSLVHALRPTKLTSCGGSLENTILHEEDDDVDTVPDLKPCHIITNNGLRSSENLSEDSGFGENVILHNNSNNIHAASHHLIDDVIIEGRRSSEDVVVLVEGGIQQASCVLVCPTSRDQHTTKATPLSASQPAAAASLSYNTPTLSTDVEVAGGVSSLSPSEASPPTSVVAVEPSFQLESSQPPQHQLIITSSQDFGQFSDVFVKSEEDHKSLENHTSQFKPGLSDEDKEVSEEEEEQTSFQHETTHLVRRVEAKSVEQHPGVRNDAEQGEEKEEEEEENKKEKASTSTQSELNITEQEFGGGKEREDCTRSPEGNLWGWGLHLGLGSRHLLSAPREEDTTTGAAAVRRELQLNKCVDLPLILAPNREAPSIVNYVAKKNSSVEVRKKPIPPVRGVSISPTSISCAAVDNSRESSNNVTQPTSEQLSLHITSQPDPNLYRSAPSLLVCNVNQANVCATMSAANRREVHFSPPHSWQVQEEPDVVQDKPLEIIEEPLPMTPVQEHAFVQNKLQVGGVTALDASPNSKKSPGSKFGNFFQRFSLRRLSGKSNKKSPRKSEEDLSVEDAAFQSVQMAAAELSSLDQTPSRSTPKTPPKSPRERPPLPPAGPPKSRLLGIVGRRSDRTTAGDGTAQTLGSLAPSVSGEASKYPGIDRSQPNHGYYETDLDQLTSKKATSLLNLGGMNATPGEHDCLDVGVMASPHTSTLPAPGGAPDSRAKSMEFLLDEDNKAAVQPPENELRKLGGESRQLSEHELRVQRSLQRLNVPDWYKNSSAANTGGTNTFSLLKRSSVGSGTQRPGGWPGLNSKTTSLSSLQQSPTPTRPRYSRENLAASPGPVSPNPQERLSFSYAPFSRWSTSRLNSGPTSANTSPGGSTRSSFHYRTPYLGWRSQERLLTSTPAHYRTPAERLAANYQHTKPPLPPTVHVQPALNDSPAHNSAEVQSSIKEVTSAIVHYVTEKNLSPAGGARPVDLDRSPSPRGSKTRVWVESSFVGSRPLDSPQTPHIPANNNGYSHDKLQTGGAAFINGTTVVRNTEDHEEGERSELQKHTTTKKRRHLNPEDPDMTGSSRDDLDNASDTSETNDEIESMVNARPEELREELTQLLENFGNCGRPSTTSTTLEDVLDSLLGLPSASRSPSPVISPGASTNHLSSRGSNSEAKRREQSTNQDEGRREMKLQERGSGGSGGAERVARILQVAATGGAGGKFNSATMTVAAAGIHWGTNENASGLLDLNWA